MVYKSVRGWTLGRKGTLLSLRTGAYRPCRKYRGKLTLSQFISWVRLQNVYKMASAISADSMENLRELQLIAALSEK